MKRIYSDKLVGYVYSNMNKRCYNPNAENYRWYGAKGVRVCDEWKNSRMAFERWVLNELKTKYGVSQWSHGWSIDRIDPKGNYNPGNCRIITLTENTRNNGKAIWLTAFGKTMTCRQWSAYNGKSSNYYNVVRFYKGDSAVLERITEDYLAIHEAAA